MIDKQTQDQLWRCAPKAFRDSVKQIYKNTELETKFLLRDIFGTFNLTSDAEPEEMISLEKGKVQFMFDGLDDTPVRCEFDRGYKTGKEFILHGLFGSKCLPDDGDKLSPEKTSEPTQPENENPSNSTPLTNDNMEEKELDLCDILKGHEGEEFFSPIIGDCKLRNMTNEYIYMTHLNNLSYCFHIDGRRENSGLCVLYPSRESYLKYPLDAKKAWMEWLEEQKPKSWRAEDGEEYWFFDRTYTPQSTTDEYTLEDELKYDSGNYFKTPELCQQAAEAVEATLEQFHKDNQQ